MASCRFIGIMVWLALTPWPVAAGSLFSGGGSTAPLVDLAPDTPRRALVRDGRDAAAPLLVASATRAPLVAVSPSGTAGDDVASLFAGRAAHSFFAPWPERHVRTLAPMVPSLGGSKVAQLRDLIALAEAGPLGYDAVQYGARIRPIRPPTQMTLGEIFAWIKATPGQPHAIGRYQFIPKTLADLVTVLDLGPEVRFSTQVQDRLADVLLDRAGYRAFRQGRLSRKGFMNNLAKVWAGLPNSSGKSHYEGYAGNHATMSWARFDRVMKAIFN